jgi:hypothetical protein
MSYNPLDGPLSLDGVAEDLRIFGLPRISERDLRYQPERGEDPGEDPQVRKLCLCGRFDFPMVVGFQCATKGGEHVRWPSNVGDVSAKLRLMRSGA